MAAREQYGESFWARLDSLRKELVAEARVIRLLRDQAARERGELGGTTSNVEAGRGASGRWSDRAFEMSGGNGRGRNVHGTGACDGPGGAFRGASVARRGDDWSEAWAGYSGCDADEDHSPEATLERRRQVVQKIDQVIQNVMTMVANDESISVSFPNRGTWKNVLLQCCPSFQPGLGLRMVADPKVTTLVSDVNGSMKRFGIMMTVLAVMKQHVLADTYCTKRDLFYQDPGLFYTQSCLDSVVDDISMLLQVPRWHLHVGVLVPNHVYQLTDLCSSARFVLIVEKDATFQKLMSDRFTSKLGPCIVVTGKGYPDVNTRLLLKRLWSTFQLPTLALVDADPHGVEIMAVYKFGSRSLSFEAPSLTVPSLKWLGVLPSDIDKMRVSREVMIPLTPADVHKARDLLDRSYITDQPYWKNELETLLRTGVKAEIQCLDSISPDFITNTYLPNKIRFGSWI